MRPHTSPASIVRDIVTHLKEHGSPEHAAGVQWFFKEEVRSHGWYTAALRRYAKALHEQLAADQALLLDVAERLFRSPFLEEKALAVTMLQPSLGRFGSPEFRRFETWLGQVSSWADHDALAMYLIGPMLVTDPRRVKRPLRWASSPSRWRRRAAAVSLIHGIRRGMFQEEAIAVTERLLADRRRHGAEGPWMAPARMGQARPEGRRAGADGDSRPGFKAGAAHGLREAHACAAQAGARSRDSWTRSRDS